MSYQRSSAIFLERMVVMTLNEDQKKALIKFKYWYKEFRSPAKCVRSWFEISGAAGTGKTTLAKYLFSSVGIEQKQILYMAYVGKATMALSRNGLFAKTIHSAIYNVEWIPYEVLEKDEDGKLIKRTKLKQEFVLKDYLGYNIKAIVVDEGSMVPNNIAEDILSFGLPVIVLGDLNQLPPVFGAPFFLQDPDAILRKIMRQAEDSPIIRLSQDILHSNRFNLGAYDKTGHVKIYEDKPGLELDYKQFDSIIVGKNKTREAYNKYIRECVYERKGPVTIGDKLICRKNNWDYFTHDGLFLINGLVGTVTDIDYEHSNNRYLSLELLPDGYKRPFTDIRLDRKLFNIPISKKREISSSFSNYDVFEYAYAITCHLSQGSQYDNVLVKYEPMGTSDYCRKWLYTAITRAIERVTLIV